MTKTRPFDRIQEHEWRAIHLVAAYTVSAMFLVALFILGNL
jgi:hypothetical protein